MSWLSGVAAGPDAFACAFALRPNRHEAWRDFATLFWERELVPIGVLELCRLRLGRLHGAEVPDLCDAMRAARAALPAAQVAAIDRWWESGAFDPTERACLRFAEQFVLDAKGMTDEQALPVVAALGEAGTVALVEALAIFDGFGRFCRMLHSRRQPGYQLLDLREHTCEFLELRFQRPY